MSTPIRHASIKHRKSIQAFVALVLLLPVSLVRATWYGEGVERGADLIMMDLRWPWWPSGIYYANWNSGIQPQGGVSFYAGFLGTLADGPRNTPNPDERLQNAFRPGSVWSFWGGDKDGNPVRFVDVAPNLLPEGDHEYIGIEYAAKPDLLPQRLKGSPVPGDQKNLVRMKQPDQPTLDKPAVRNVQAESTGAQVAVSWEIPETSSPAFAYKIEVLDNPACTGTPKAIAEERLPSARRAIVNAAISKPTVRLTVLDVFDQSASAVTVPATETKLLPAPTPPARTIPGLSYELYQSPEHEGGKPWQKLDELKQGRLVRQGLARGFDLSVNESINAGYAVVFNGLLRVPEDGIYIFYGQIDGAYRIQIDGREVIVRDEQAGTTEHDGFCRLAKGDHAIQVEHLYGRLLARNFNLDWEGPHLPRQTIPVEALFVADDSAYPKPEFTSASLASGLRRSWSGLGSMSIPWPAGG